MSLCECGCGEETTVSKHNKPSIGAIKGQPFRFKRGHRNRHCPIIIPHSQRHSVDSTTGCWNWLLSKTTAGYGIERIKNKFVMAHRRYYEEQYGAIPYGLQLDHLCRNRGCVNPEHLEPVTNAVNTRRGCNIVINHAIAAQIRKLYGENDLGYRALGKKIGISPHIVRHVVSGHTWNTPGE